MKAFLLSVLALILLCVVVFWNSASVIDISDKMSDVAIEIESLEDIDKLEELEEIWDKYHFILSISVPHKATDELDRNLVLLRAKFDEGISTEITETIALTLRTIDEIRIHAVADANNVL